MAGPQVALVYNLTRKAADVGKNLVDMIGFASYGGFAHLVAASQPSEIRRVYLEIRFLRLAAAVAVACAFLVVNHALVKIWVGEAAFGGTLLTGLFAVQLVATGDTYLVNYLFRATGAVERGSWILAAEALCRMVLMVLGMRLLGLYGIPLASILVSIPFLVWVDRLLLNQLDGSYGRKADWSLLTPTYALGGGLLIVSGWWGSNRLIGQGWLLILAGGTLSFLAAFATLVWGAHPEARNAVVSMLRSILFPRGRQTR